LSYCQSQEQAQEQQEKSEFVHKSLHQRAISIHYAIGNRAWKEKWPLVTETELKRTESWILKPYQKHTLLPATAFPSIAGILFMRH
jgi:hypothetical protein